MILSPSLEQRENRELASEVKFVVPAAMAEKLREWARKNLEPDPHASIGAGDQYQITTLYFDTKNFDVFHRRGSFGRSKFRIRRYNTEPLAFLERKLKTRGLVTKRRSPVHVEDLQHLCDAPRKTWIGFWYHQRLQLRRLETKCQISYLRTARVALTPVGPVRMTIDDQVRALPTNRMAFATDDLSTVLLPYDVIVELKFRAGMPVLFKELVETFALQPQAISKYRLAASRLQLVESNLVSFPQGEKISSYA